MDVLPEEIRLEIVYRLNIRPLFRFKCVSKLWNSIISDPKFGRNYVQRLKSSSSSCHLSAVLYSGTTIDFTDDDDDDDDDDEPPSLYVSYPKYSFIWGSSNGLILTCPNPKHNDNDNDYTVEFDLCVSNPLTNQSVKLPTLHFSENQWACGVATRAKGENQDCINTYIVVFIKIMKKLPAFAKIDIFCSETGCWTCTERLIRCPAAVLNGAMKQAITYKGIFHCFDWGTRSLVTYDPYDSPDGFGSILLPSGSSAGKKVINTGLRLIRLGHEGLIEFGEMEDWGDGCWRLCVWRLVDYDKRVWSLYKRYPISPLFEESVLSDCELLVAPYPWNDESFWLFTYKDTVIVHDLASAEKVSVDPYEGCITRLVPIALNPWSSLFHGQARCNSSSKPGYTNIISAWFPPFSKHTGK